MITECDSYNNIRNILSTYTRGFKW